MLSHTNKDRVSATSLGASKSVKDFEDVETNDGYFLVKVGLYGVVLPDTLNAKTLDGIQLVKGKATRLDSLNLAERLAEETNGVIICVSEVYSRKVSNLK